MAKHTLLQMFDSLASAPLRTCNSLHHCCICNRSIMMGERYRDRGYGRRAHDACLKTAASDLKRVLETA
jgi:hypothetical protein